MVELREHSLAPRVPFFNEEEIREIEKKIWKDPMEVGSFHIHESALDLPQTRRTEPSRIYIDNFCWPKPEEIIATSTVTLIRGTGARTRWWFTLGKEFEWPSGVATAATGTAVFDLNTVVFDLNVAVSSSCATAAAFGQLGTCWGVYSTPALPSEKKEAIRVELDREAAKRLDRHEQLLEKLVSLAEEEASSRDIPIAQIEVSPAWSLEYEDRTGLVIKVEIRGTDDQRFSVWDSLSEKIDHLSETLSKEEQVFLANDISLVVTQG